MAESCQVIVVGKSLFSAALIQVLTDSEAVVILSATPTLEEAMPLIEAESPDVVIVAHMEGTSQATLDSLLAAYPDLPIIRTDLNHDYMQVITSQQINARPADLLATIASLPKRK